MRVWGGTGSPTGAGAHGSGPRSHLLGALALALALGCGLAGCGDAAGSAHAAGASGSAAPAPPPPAGSDGAPALDVAASAGPAGSAAPVLQADDWVERALRASDPRFAEWLARAHELRLQILVTVVEPGAATWVTHGYRADAEYFYPASAVKVFLAVAALRALDERAGRPIAPGTRIRRCRSKRPGCEPPDPDVDDEDSKKGEGESKPGDDPDAPKKHKKLYVGEELAKLLTFSDNESYNRFWDVVGHRELNERMAALGFPAVRFHHRMDTPAERSKQTLRVLLSPPRGKGFEVRARDSDLVLAPTPAPELSIGTAYLDGRRRVDAPMSFAAKNYAPLADLQRIERALLFPERPDSAPLGLDPSEHKLLVDAMTAHLPGSARMNDHHPLAPGVLEVVPAERVRYVGKAGRAYGFLLDNAFVEDRTSHRGFFVTATVYANPDGVMNDDDYAYDELARPILKAVGAAIARAVFGS
ncbi:MAG: serine hydrolase [Polyangiaceae bacterium]|nr:serine hydrolase [Polyangiaceae bacterium]